MNKKFNKNLWHNYGATQFANSLATIEPKIEFDDKKIQNEWNIFKSNNNLLMLNYKLVYETSKNCVYGLGIKFLNNEAILTTGKVIDYKKIGNNLLNLKIALDIFDNKNYYELDMFDLENHKYIIKKGMTLINSNIINVKEIPLSSYESEKNLFDIIPYQLFFANPLMKNDFYNLDEKWIDDYLEHLKLLLTDSFISKGIIHLNKPNIQSNDRNYKQLKFALTDSESIIFENENLFSLLQEGGLQIQQANSNSFAIIEKLKFYESKIKQFSFLKKETLDLGTKNLQSSETNLLNQDWDDYIEMKANFFEIQWEYFLKNVFLNYLKNYKNFDIDIQKIKIDVEIAGSTKFLKNRKNLYFQTQQGSLINPNDFVTNNFFEKKENSHEKEK